MAFISVIYDLICLQIIFCHHKFIPSMHCLQKIFGILLNKIPITDNKFEFLPWQCLIDHVDFRWTGSDQFWSILFYYPCWFRVFIKVERRKLGLSLPQNFGKGYKRMERLWKFFCGLFVVFLQKFRYDYLEKGKRGSERKDGAHEKRKRPGQTAGKKI